MTAKTTLLLSGFALVLGLGASAQADWYNTNWRYRKPITINHTQVTTSLTNFPVLVYCAADDDLATDALDSGADILFTAADGTTKLSREIEAFNGTTGELWAWVKVPVLSTTTDTVICIYYGNSAGTEGNDTSTWDGNFKGVWHVNSNLQDSTSNGYNGGNAGSAATTGKLSGGRYFNGNQAYINIGNAIVNNIGQLTVECWLYRETNSGTWDPAICKWTNGTGPVYFGVDAGGASLLQYYVVTGANGASSTNSANALPLGTWIHAVGVYDGAHLRAYVNGLPSGPIPSQSGSTVTGSQNLRFGCEDPSSAYPGWRGSLDEIRISDIGRSAGWIATEYYNQSAPTTFLGFGAEEVFGDVYVESRTGGKNFSTGYRESSGWATGTSKSSAAGMSSGIGCRYAPANISGATARFQLPSGSQAGVYEVYLTWKGGSSRVTTAPVKVDYDQGMVQTTFDQTANGDQWSQVGIGGVQLSPGRYVEFNTTGALPADSNRYVIADGAWFHFLGPTVVASKTPTFTSTVTPTASKTPTPTITPTFTPTSNNTATPTATPTVTPTPTATFYSWSSIPPFLDYQGRLLTQPSGAPIADGSYALDFSLWTVSRGGNPATDRIWSESLTDVSVMHGVFGVRLGELVPFPKELFVQYPEMYLETAVQGQDPLLPRRRLTSVAYAIKAYFADEVQDGAITASSLRNGAATSAKVNLTTGLVSDASATAVSDSEVCLSNGSATITVPSGCSGKVLLNWVARATMTGTGGQTILRVVRDGTVEVASCTLSNNNTGLEMNLANFNQDLNVPAGSHTYQLCGRTSTGSVSTSFAHCQLMAVVMSND